MAWNADFPSRKIKILADALAFDWTRHTDKLCAAVYTPKGGLDAADRGMISVLYHAEGTTAPDTVIRVKCLAVDANSVASVIKRALTKNGIRYFDIGNNNVYSVWPNLHLTKISCGTNKFKMKSHCNRHWIQNKLELHTEYPRMAGEILIVWANWRDEYAEAKKAGPKRKIDEVYE